MGTNYYANIEICPTCKRPKEEVHLGKNSYGWTFALQANGFRYYKDWEEMKEWLKGKKIKDEYGKTVSLRSFIAMVESKKDIEAPEDVNYPADMGIKVGSYTFHDCEFS